MRDLKSNNSFLHIFIGYGKAIFISKHRQSTKREISIFNLFALTTLMFLLPLYGCQDEQNKPGNNFTSAIKQISGQKTVEGAIDASIKFVSQEIDFPQNAIYPKQHGTNVSIDEDGKYIIKSYVETRKDCGPKERRYYTSILSFEKGKWKLESLEF